MASNVRFHDRRRSKLVRAIVRFLFAGLIDMNFAAIRRYVILFEVIAFEALVVLAWLSELFDFPSRVLGAPASEPNFQHALLQTIWTMALMMFVMGVTLLFFKQIRYLEGFLPVCSFCKSIRVDQRWVPLEQYLQERTAVTMTHSLCPPCAKKHYGYEEHETTPDQPSTGGGTT